MESVSLMKSFTSLPMFPNVRHAWSYQFTAHQHREKLPREVAKIRCFGFVTMLNLCQFAFLFIDGTLCQSFFLMHSLSPRLVSGLNDAANALDWVFLLMPQYCLGQGLADVYTNSKMVNICTSSEPFKLICNKESNMLGLCWRLARYRIIAAF